MLPAWLALATQVSGVQVPSFQVLLREAKAAKIPGAYSCGVRGVVIYDKLGPT